MFSAFDLLAFSQIPFVGTQRLRQLVSCFPDAPSVVGASAKEIAAMDGFSKKLGVQVARFLRSSKFDAAKQYAEKQLSRLNKAGGRIVAYDDKSYPDGLRKIYDPPAFLFVQGEFSEEDKYALAIVGTRSPSTYGTSMAERFSQGIARLGVTVVSGLARGVDTVAHAAAFKSGGRTIAVIGSGLDVIYPPENRNLAERITRRGAVVSEYEMGAKPDAGNFPRRNRIISGLSLGTLIIETDVNGGAMITASTALDQNREVFALPGMISSKRSHGCNVLIKEGKAKLVESLDDIIVELSTKLKPLLASASPIERPLPPNLTLFEQKLIEVLSDSPQHIDVIADRLPMATSDALVNLLSLEFKGLVKQLPGKLFIRL